MTSMRIVHDDGSVSVGRIIDLPGRRYQVTTPAMPSLRFLSDGTVTFTWAQTSSGSSSVVTHSWAESVARGLLEPVSEAQEAASG